MLESEIFALLEQTADAAFATAADGEICSWNRAAEQLLGYTANEVLGQNIDVLIEPGNASGTGALTNTSRPDVDQDRLATGIPNYDVEVQTKSQQRIWVNVSTIVFDNQHTGRRLFIRLVRDIELDRRNEELVLRMTEAAQHLIAQTRDPFRHATVESLSEQELRILKLFAEGQSAAAIGEMLGISQQTLRNHLHHINLKLRTHNRLEAVTHAKRRGLID